MPKALGEIISIGRGDARVFGIRTRCGRSSVDNGSVLEAMGGCAENMRLTFTLSHTKFSSWSFFWVTLSQDAASRDHPSSHKRARPFLRRVASRLALAPLEVSPRQSPSPAPQRTLIHSAPHSRGCILPCPTFIIFFSFPQTFFFFSLSLSTCFSPLQGASILHSTTTTFSPL